ncbi:DUF2892 domain-containing protein [Hymenobacter sp. BT635]|uniref:DUF2892 domain-containing protein n=1 Tax=Hymenobacter nitidus TaxID=2880929 RepID=A0ABS8AFL2_9BACT|nr:DUF2892 domain-containing protein [Hymenobacter nitidus]MCB2379213.1 DUF2892 domain-containing protein [Hymenobacter nitidus]
MEPNLCFTDRLLRAVLAFYLVSVLIGPGLTGAWLLGGLPILVLVWTSAVGFCPLYAWLGISSRRPG